MRLNRRKINYTALELCVNADMHNKVITRRDNTVLMHINTKTVAEKYSYFLNMTVEEATQLRDQLSAALEQ